VADSTPLTADSVGNKYPGSLDSPAADSAEAALSSNSIVVAHKWALNHPKITMHPKRTPGSQRFVPGLESGAPFFPQLSLVAEK
jgi:hypothetical protein